jgi:hypothetical protein
MGRVLEYVNRQHHRAFDWVISMMTNKEPVMRVTDIDVLKILFNSAFKSTLKDCQ